MQCSQSPRPRGQSGPAACAPKIADIFLFSCPSIKMIFRFQERSWRGRRWTSWSRSAATLRMTTASFLMNVSATSTTTFLQPSFTTKHFTCYLSSFIAEHFIHIFAYIPRIFPICILNIRHNRSSIFSAFLRRVCAGPHPELYEDW